MSTLLKEFKQIDDSDPNQWSSFFARLQQHPDHTAAMEAACKIILSSEDHFVWYTIAEYFARDLYFEGLPTLKERAKKLPKPKHPAIRDYRQVIRDSIKHLEVNNKGKQCGCLSRREKPSSQKNIVVDNEVVHQKEYYTEIFCHCSI